MPALHTLVDDFNDGVRAAVWADTYGSVTEANGMVTIVADANWCAMATAPSWSLVNSSAFAQVAPARGGSVSNQAYSTMYLYQAGLAGTRLIFSHAVNGDTIRFGSDVDYWDPTSVALPYDPVAMAWWRFREAAGQVYMETSPDGQTWTIRHQVATPTWATGEDLILAFEPHDAGGTGVMTIDNVNTTGIANAGVDQVVRSYSPVILSAAGNGSWSQASGPAVTLHSSGTLASFVTPGLPANTDLIFGYGGDQVVVTVQRTHSIRSSGGGWTPFRIRPKRAAFTRQALPTKVVGGYWEGWNTLPLRDVPSGYNVVYVSFAIASQAGTAKMRLEAPGQTDASLRQDIKTLQGQGRPVILSVGGWEDGGIRLQSTGDVADFVNSMSSIIDSYGFDGFDWDIEHLDQINGEAMYQASRELRRRVGDDLLITAAFGPNSTVYKQFGQRMGADLDMAGIMFYDYPATEQEVVDKTTEMIEVYGIAPSRVGVGYMIGENLDELTPATMVSAFNQLDVAYPDIRGAYNWSINGDQALGYQFLSEVAPDILDSAPPVASEPVLYPAKLRSVGTSTVVSTTTDKATAKPGGVAEGDLMIFVLTSYGTNAANCALPSGFTQIASHARSTSHTLKIGWKVATASEPTAYTPTIPSGNSHRADILAYYDVDPAQLGTPIIGSTPVSSTAHAAPSITPTTDHGLLVTLVSGGGGNTWTPPAGMTERTDSTTGASHYLTLATADQTLTTADATGTRTWGGGGGNYAQITASLFIPSLVTADRGDGGSTAPVTMLGFAPTDGSGGSKTDQEAILFQATQGAQVSSSYHRYAAHLQGDGPYPLVIHLHGDGAYEYENPNTWTSPQYMDIARSINGLGIIPLTPDISSGFQRWWEGYEPTYWLVDLIAELKRTYNIDENRMFISGFSGGAVVTTVNLVADWPEIFAGGGAMMLGGGGAYTTGTPVPAGLQDQFLMRWHVGDSDEGYNDDGSIADDGYDAISAAQAGELKYRQDGWNTAIELIPGGTDHLESEPMGPSRLQSLIDEFSAQFGF